MVENMLCLPGGVNDPWLSPGDDARSVWDCTPVPPDVVMFSGDVMRGAVSDGVPVSCGSMPVCGSRF